MNAAVLRDAARRIESGPSLPIDCRYRSYATILSTLEGYCSRGASARCIGATAGGRDLVALEWGSPDARIVRVLLSGIHALEWIGVEVALGVLECLLHTDNANCRTVVVPVVNVDGYLSVEADLAEGRRSFRRGNEHGVDLNRNWPTAFRRDAPLARLLPNVFSSGPAPLSEPEISAVVRMLDGVVATGASIDRAVSLHSFGRKILYPWGSRWRAPPAVDRLRAAASALRDQFDENYSVVQSARWVPGAFAYGMEIDHLHAAYGATALLVECSGGGFSPMNPRTWLRPFDWFNPIVPHGVVRDLAAPIARFLSTG